MKIPAVWRKIAVGLACLSVAAVLLLALPLGSASTAYSFTFKAADPILNSSGCWRGYAALDFGSQRSVDLGWSSSPLALSSLTLSDSSGHLAYNGSGFSGVGSLSPSGGDYELSWSSCPWDYSETIQFSAVGHHSAPLA